MRTLPLAVVVSAMVHAVVVAWLATRPASAARPDDGASAVTLIEIVTVDPPPAAPSADPEIELRLAPAAATPATAALPPSEPAPRAAPARRPPGEPAAVAARPGRETAPPPATGETAPARAPGLSPLAMRRGGAPSAALPFGRWDALDHPPAGTAPERVAASGLLRESGGGSFRSEQSPFTADVRPDGTVAITDRPSFDIHLALPTPRLLGRALAAWYESDKGEHGNEGDTSASQQIQVSGGSPAALKDPVTGESEDHVTTVIFPVLGGGSEITDWLMRLQGQDPYSSRKRAFLDATRDERAQIGRRHRSEQLALTPQIVLRSLEALWAATPDLAARKQALFELWDDCVETGDPEIVAAGEAARRMMIGFIRGHLPAGGPDAYTPAELAELARRRHSKAAFAPYD